MLCVAYSHVCEMNGLGGVRTRVSRLNLSCCVMRAVSTLGSPAAFRCRRTASPRCHPTTHSSRPHATAQIINGVRSEEARLRRRAPANGVQSSGDRQLVRRACGPCDPVRHRRPFLHLFHLIIKLFRSPLHATLHTTPTPSTEPTTGAPGLSYRARDARARRCFQMAGADGRARARL